jgi:transposase
MSAQPQRAFTTAFKVSVVLRLQAGERLAAVANELRIKRKLLYQWRHAYRRLGVAGLNRKRGPKPGGKSSGSPPGRQQADLDFFRTALRLMVDGA